jgi:cytochrome d ubiquinol oxidase subunit I
MKMAAAEALWDSADPAPMSLFTWGDEAQRRDRMGIKVPGLLSFLAYNRFEGEVKGIKNLQVEYEYRYGPGDYVPPVMWTYWTFRIMAGAGLVMLALSIFSRCSFQQSPCRTSRTRRAGFSRRWAGSRG